MKRAGRYGMLLLLLALATLPLWPAPASAQGALSARSGQAVVRFAESVRFSVEARSDANIREAILFYRVAGSRVTTRAYAEFRPAKEISASYVWELEAGDLAPGSEVTYYWEIYDVAGAQLRTDKQAFVYNDDRFNWQEVREGLVRMFYYQGRRPDDLLKAAQSAIEKQQREIGVVLEKPIRIYVYANRNDMRKAIPSRSARYDEMTTTLGMVLADDTLLLLGSAPGVEKTLAHELSHIVVGLATAGPLSRLPRWLDEGLAMYAEGQLPAHNRRALEQAIRDDNLISVRSLSGYAGDPALVDLFYAESYSLIAFLLEQYGREKLLELLQTFKRGAHQEDALQKVYGFNLDELDGRWRQHLGLAPRPAGGAPMPTRAPTVGFRREIDWREWCGAGLLPAFLGLFGVVCRRPLRTHS